MPERTDPMKGTEKTEKLVVIGNGMTGIACVEQVLKYDKKFEIVIFGKIGLMQGDVQRPSETAACVRTFATRVEAGTVLVKVTSETIADFSRSARPGATGDGDKQLRRTEGTQA